MKWSNIIHIFFFPLFLLILSSCGATDEEKVDVAIQTAKRFLSSSDCTNAIQVLNDVGFQPKNASYLSVYSSSYACVSGFNEPMFFATDLPRLAAIGSDASLLYGPMSRFSVSGMTSPTSLSFTSLQTAINTLIFAGGITSASHANRLDFFTSAEASNMGVQALYMLMSQMGQYLKYYGNASAGVKGAGAASNTCLVTYTDNSAKAVITALPGTNPCTDPNTDVGHTQMETASAANKKTQMCQFVTLFNNFIDVLANVSFTGTETGTLGVLSDVFGTLCSVAMTAAGGGTDLCTIKTQTTCEGETDADLQLFFAVMVESLF